MELTINLFPVGDKQLNDIFSSKFMAKGIYNDFFCMFGYYFKTISHDQFNALR